METGLKKDCHTRKKIDEVDSSLKKPSLLFEIKGAVLYIDFIGKWDEKHLVYVRKKKDVLSQYLLSNKQYTKVCIECKNLTSWDMTFLCFITTVSHTLIEKNKEYSIDNLPEKAEKLLKLALVVPKACKQEVKEKHEAFFEKIGELALKVPGCTFRAFAFFKEMYFSFLRLLVGKNRMYSKDLWDALFECSVNALGIISLTSLLLGLILAFVATVQLSLFGAEVYVASFVGLSMVRIMGALLTGIILSGRTGASFAAIIGTMQVNEEVDALQTFGISPYDFLVMPRVIALVVMVPLLTLYANIMGIIGGLLVALVIGLTPQMYMQNLLEYMHLRYLWIGLFHAFTFGIVISFAGCYQGMRCGRSAEAVGQATTSAVVISLVGIIVVTSIITIILSILGW